MLVEGPALLGFSDFFVGRAHTIHPQKHGVVRRPHIMPRSIARPHSVIQRHGDTVQTAKKMLASVTQSLSKVRRSLAKTPPAARTHVGAVPSAKTRTAQRRLDNAVARSQRAKRRLAKHALKAKAAAQRLAKSLVKQKQVLQQLRTPPSKRTHIGATQQLTSDPLDTGVLTTPPAMNTYIPDYRKVNGILYDESHGRPDGFAGSYGLMHHETDKQASGGYVLRAGYVWGSFDRDQIPNGMAYGGGLGSNQWNRIHGAWIPFASGKFWNSADPSEVASSPSLKTKDGKPYGPIVGNPGMSDFKAMRMDGQGNFFWHPAEAPEWLTAPLKKAIDQTQKDSLTLQTAAQDVAASSQENDAADTDVDQAAQDLADATAAAPAPAPDATADATTQLPPATSPAPVPVPPTPTPPTATIQPPTAQPVAPSRQEPAPVAVVDEVVDDSALALDDDAATDVLEAAAADVDDSALAFNVDGMEVSDDDYPIEDEPPMFEDDLSYAEG